MINRLINELATLTSINFVDYADSKNANSVSIMQTGRIDSDMVEMDFTLYMYMVDSECINKMAIVDKAVADGKVQELSGFKWVADDTFMTKSFKIFISKSKFIEVTTGQGRPLITTSQIEQ